MAGAILTLNGGSSSIKFSLFKIASDNILSLAAHGEVEGIGTAPRFSVRNTAGRIVAEQNWPNASEAFERLLETVINWAEKHLGSDTLIAVGHRVVHGGASHYRPERVTPELMRALDGLIPLAPLHQPHNLMPIRSMQAMRPNLPQVACFDTGFHHTMPTTATRFALPREYEEKGVRRYGFHGLSYEFIVGKLRESAPRLAEGRVIAAHLGNGASLCAIRGGSSIDTTMGFTALDGLVMGTRCGDLDPGVILYLEQECGMSVGQVEDILYRKSGLLGVSQIASDMRALLADPDPRAKDAIELFVYRIAREVGALTSSLGGLDGLIFTAGIGERAPAVREMVCARLDWLGVVLDPEANARNQHVISTKESQVEVHVIPTDEEVMIARHTVEIIAPNAG